MQAATGETATGVFEKNFIYNYGTDGVQSIGWSGFDCNGQNIIVRNNVIANGVDGQTPTDANTINGMKFATRNDQTPLTDGRVYGNIFWNAGMIFGTTSAWVNLTTPVTGNEIYNNIFHGVDLGEKDSAIEDAPIQVNFTTGGLGTNNRIYSNNITRDPGDTNASTSMVVRTGAGTYTQYGINGVLAGYENNTALDPQFADAANGDFTVGNATLRATLPTDMPYTRALTGAWRPPGV
jgi:hypothetical protein